MDLQVLRINMGKRKARIIEATLEFKTIELLAMMEMFHTCTCPLW